MAGSPQDVTLLLEAVFAGDKNAGKRLFSVVYQELHTLAHAAMRKESPGHPLQTTALVHEAYIRLVKWKDERWENRAHFFSTAARAMRRILVDEARSRNAAKRGRGVCPVSLDGLKEDAQKGKSPSEPFEDLELLDRALDKLAGQEIHHRKCTVVEFRFFVGLTLEQTAEILGVSTATVKRDWEFTRAWLRREMKRAADEKIQNDA